MQLIATLTGTGWLRTKEAGSAVATYRLDIYRETSGAEQGQWVTRGVLAAEAWALVVAKIDRTAVLVLDTGEPVDVRLIDLGASDTTSNFIVSGKMPAF